MINYNDLSFAGAKQSYIRTVGRKQVPFPKRGIQGKGDVTD